jgi:hypothetical protein
MRHSHPDADRDADDQRNDVDQGQHPDSHFPSQHRLMLRRQSVEQKT